MWSKKSSQSYKSHCLSGCNYFFGSYFVIVLRQWIWVKLNFTCFDHHEVQRVIPDVGDSSDIMDGHSQNDVFSIAPHKLYVVCWQAHHRILLWCQLACQLMGLLRTTEAHNQGYDRYCGHHISPHISPYINLLTQILTLAVSMSCSTSVRLDGFKYPGTDVSCPKYWTRQNMRKRFLTKSRSKPQVKQCDPVSYNQLYKWIVRQHFSIYIPASLTHFDFLLNVIIEQDVRVDAVVRLREWECVEGPALGGFLLGLLVSPLLSFQEDSLERRHDTRLENEEWRKRAGWREIKYKIQ